VDDDAEDIELLVNAIYDFDINICCSFSQSGEEALQVITNLESYPDIIILDLNMPKLDGKGFLKTIKGNTSLCHIPIVIYSTSNSKEDMNETMVLGAVSYTVKPSTYNGISQFVQSIMTSYLASTP